MSRRLLLRAASGVLLAGVAIATYLLWIPVHRPDPSKLAALASTSPVAGVRPPARTLEDDPAKSSLSAVSVAAASTPGETGSYSVDWHGAAPVSSASVTLTVLPTTTAAQAALKEAKSSDAGSTSLTSIGYGFGGTTRVPGIPGARGAYYLKGTSPQVKPTTPRAAVVVYRLGRVVVGVTVAAKGVHATATARDLASAEFRHLRSVGADPAIGETHVPVTASILFVLVAVAVIALSQMVLGPLSTLGQRRAELRLREERRASLARGSKVVKRHAARGYAARVETRSRGRR